jgi:hypothetical protein
MSIYTTEDPSTKSVDIDRQQSNVVDHFAAQRTDDNNPFGRQDNHAEMGTSSTESGSPKGDRRMSKEWGMLHSPCL